MKYLIYKSISSYKVEEPDGDSYYMDEDGNINNDYWKLYSELQKRRFKKVLNQINITWFNVLQQMFFMREHISNELSNEMCYKLPKQFINELKYQTKYYSEENIKLRKNKNYKLKKINKIKNKIYNL